jgi:hypothetical protein
VKGIEHRNRVRKAVVDGVGVSAERIQGRLLDIVDEALRLGFQPGPVDAAGRACQVFCVRQLVLVTGGG